MDSLLAFKDLPVLNSSNVSGHSWLAVPAFDLQVLFLDDSRRFFGGSGFGLGSGLRTTFLSFLFLDFSGLKLAVVISSKFKGLLTLELLGLCSTFTNLPLSPM